VTIAPFTVPHGGWTHAYGWRIRTRDRVIVISGDTGPTEEIVTQCNGCDVLVHEVRSHEKLATRPPAWQAYHRRFHTSTLELAALAGRARPKLLVLYHQLYWGATDDDLIREVRSVYSGAVVSARDLGIY
jgi:ribonuclease BN (tRNA processing enzyme)